MKNFFLVKSLVEQIMLFIVQVTNKTPNNIFAMHNLLVKLKPDDIACFGPHKPRS